MRFTHTIELISSTETENSIGNLIEEKTYHKIFVDKRSVKQGEFYQAAASGFKPEIVFIARVPEYNNETEVRYMGKEYTVTRTYTKDNQLLEIVCSGIVGTEVRDDAETQL